MYYEEETDEKPKKWPANAREQIFDARIKTGLVKWKNQLVYGTMS